MIDKDSCNPVRSGFIEALIEDIPSIEGYDKFGISRENVGLIVTYIIHKFSKIKDDEGIEAVDEIITYRLNERKLPKIN